MARGERPSTSLSIVLGEIYAADIPLAERRALARMVVLQTASGCLDNVGKAKMAETCPVPSPIISMENALLAVAKATGTSNRVTIKEAKAWARACGESGSAIAARLSKLSKSRNATAHPDISLADDIATLALSNGKVRLPYELKDGCSHERADAQDDFKKDVEAEMVAVAQKDFKGKNSRLDRIEPENAKHCARQIPVDTLDVLAHAVASTFARQQSQVTTRGALLEGVNASLAGGGKAVASTLSPAERERFERQRVIDECKAASVKFETS